MKKMKNIVVNIICLLVIINCFSCKKHDDLIPVFEVQEISADQADLISSFAVLTDNDATGCNIIADRNDIPDNLCNILINAEEGSEVIFLVDATGSMSDDIDQVKQNIIEILQCLPDGVRIGAGTYGDNRLDPTNWFTGVDLTEDKGAIEDFILSINVLGGGDFPESVFDAIWKALDEFSWRDCEAPDTIIVMGDAPPKVGLDTDHSADDVLAKAESLCSNTLFVPIIILDI